MAVSQAVLPPDDGALPPEDDEEPPEGAELAEDAGLSVDFVSLAVPPPVSFFAACL
jgi:hypothetical protein